MCVLGRSFGIRQMTQWGVNCFLVRDLTDTMYNPAPPPKVSHDEGTERVVQHIEKYWCPSLLSTHLMNALAHKWFVYFIPPDVACCGSLSTGYQDGKDGQRKHPLWPIGPVLRH